MAEQSTSRSARLLHGLVQGRRRRLAAGVGAGAVLVGLLAVPASSPLAASGNPCAAPVNTIACENTKTGTPKATWDVSGSGSSTIQGFATDISANLGDTVQFKIKTPAKTYRIDIYRLGYYQGNGARLVGSVTPSATLPQTQPACQTQTATGLVDCGNWAVSASWKVPTDAVSGVYIARPTRTDGTTGASHIPFVVRDDTSHSGLLFQTSDTTWQAYNSYGGNSLYVGSPVGRAYKVSYNRPFITRDGDTQQDWLFNAEYPMIRFLEQNGYDVTYSSGIDSDRRGALIKNHKTFLSVGHDEYWSGNQRANVEAARDAGVNLAFFSGNESFWKTRWENGLGTSGAPYRTLVTYKETHANAVIDPQDPPTWTGTWRDKRFSPPADGGRPENAMTGTIFMVNGSSGSSYSIQVPQADGKMRIWRNTSVATLGSGATATFPTGTLGYEWDSDLDNGSRPAGLIDLSTATWDVSPNLLLDNGSTYGDGSATHHLTLYRAVKSKALVFGAGTIQWAWGLDANHDRSGTPSDVRMQQATVNLLADMGAQPYALIAGLVPATASTDTTAPTSRVTTPAPGTNVQSGAPFAIVGTATDTGGGVVGGVEVSTDGGSTWHPAKGRESWTYTWTPGDAGPATILTRATDDSANTETPSAGTAVTVVPRACPCSLFSASAAPTNPADSDASSTELGVKFKSDTDGVITGIRFYKGPGNTGTHTGHLWTSTGTLLGSVTFTGESGSGWQQANFSTPLPVTAGTVYVASYLAPSGHYAEDDGTFAGAGIDSAPLHALAAGVSGPNGVYAYGPSGTFPTQDYQSANYWVDVVFSGGGPDTTPPTVTGVSPVAGATNVGTTTGISATFSEALDAGKSTIVLSGPGESTVPGTAGYNSATRSLTFQPGSPLNPSNTYTVSVFGTDTAGNKMSVPYNWTFTTAAPGPACPCSIWSTSTTPTTKADSDATSVELGVKFRANQNGTISGIRFYKGSGNTGTHVARLWSAAGTQLATATFTGETATGWQTVSFATPVSITAGTTYVASYRAPKGHYAADESYFSSAGVDSGPLHALSQAEGDNGVYTYAAAGSFPSSTYASTNYWVDVIFTSSG